MNFARGREGQGQKEREKDAGGGDLFSFFTAEFTEYRCVRKPIVRVFFSLNFYEQE